MVTWLHLWQGRGCSVAVPWVKVSTMAVLLHPAVRLQRWREWHTMRFMLISDALCLSLQSSEECGVLRVVAADCCSHVKHACSRNVKSTELLFHHNYPQRSMSDAPNAKNVPDWPFQIRLRPAFSLWLWPHFPVGSGWGVSFGQTEGSRGRAAYVCMRLKLALVFLSHTVGLSSCFHCPSLLPIDRREDKREREREMLLHCHKFLLSGRP